MHVSTIVTIAITGLAQLAVCQSIDPSTVSDATKGQIILPRNGIDEILMTYRPVVH